MSFNFDKKGPDCKSAPSGVQSLTNELYLKENSKTKKVGKLIVGELTSEREPDEK